MTQHTPIINKILRIEMGIHLKNFDQIKYNGYAKKYKTADRIIKDMPSFKIHKYVNTYYTFFEILL